MKIRKKKSGGPKKFKKLELYSRISFLYLNKALKNPLILKVAERKHKLVFKFLEKEQADVIAKYKDIKEKLIKRLKRTYRECVCFDISDIRKIVNELPEYEFVPNLVDRDINADEDKLFDRNVTDVIKYLSSYKDYELIQRWSGYESNYFVFSKKEEETEEEIFERLYDIVKTKYSNLLTKKSEIVSLNMKKKALQDKIKELDKQIKSL